MNANKYYSDKASNLYPTGPFLQMSNIHAIRLEIDQLRQHACNLVLGARLPVATYDHMNDLGGLYVYTVPTKRSPSTKNTNHSS